MKSFIQSAVLMSIVFLFAACAASAQQTGLSDPPPILEITKLVAKPGKLGALVKIEAERAQLLKTAKWSRNSIASSSVTGAQQIWLFACYNALGDVQKDQEYADRTPALKEALDKLDAAEGDLLESKRVVTATYQKNISYRPQFDWSEVKFWEIIWVHLRTGHHEAYIENRLMTREEHDRGAYDTHQMMYAVQSGEPSGTFFVIRPMKSLALLDDLHAHNDGEPATDEEEKRKVELFAESGLSEEEAYFKVDPRMSYVPNP